MLNAEQHKRQFLARVIPLTCLFLVFVVFTREQWMYPVGEQAYETTLVHDVHPGGFSEAMLVADSKPSDDRSKPAQPERPAGLFSTDITNRFFQQQWKQHDAKYQPVLIPAVKRYLLFSCLRLSETPLPA